MGATRASGASGPQTSGPKAADAGPTGAGPTRAGPTGGAEPADREPPELGYEQARAELAEVVRRLEAGGLSLEDSLGLWERGERLADICQTWLDGARQRLDAALASGPAQDEPGHAAG